MAVGHRIKAQREALGISQDELARKLGYQSRSSINKIESGERDLPQSKIKAIADALGVSPSVIMGWDEEPVDSLNAATEPQLFVPHELKTIEVDTEKKIFRVNGEDFGKGCSYFMISCDAADGYKVRLEIDAKVILASYEGIRRASVSERPAQGQMRSREERGDDQ